ncbi:MAG: hypothetical protein KDE33_08315 [Bacteroidetes bacterium]|nr:hypothetical protein [Bacteroidota bacterium]
MGRISNVKSLHLTKLENNKKQGNLYLQKHSLLNLRLEQYILGLFEYSSLQELGFLISKLNLNSKIGGSLVIDLYLYDLKFGLLTSVLDQKYQKEKFLVLTEYSLKLLFLEKILLDNLKKLGIRNVSCRYHFQSNYQMSALLIVKYLVSKLEQQFSLGEALFPLVRYLNKAPTIYGFRIDCSGRFTRKQRASVLTVKGGTVPFSSLKSNLDYEESSVILKYGKCGLKVWLHCGQESKGEVAEYKLKF